MGLEESLFSHVARPSHLPYVSPLNICSCGSSLTAVAVVNRKYYAWEADVDESLHKATPKATPKSMDSAHPVVKTTQLGDRGAPKRVRRRPRYHVLPSALLWPNPEISIGLVFIAGAPARTHVHLCAHVHSHVHALSTW